MKSLKWIGVFFGLVGGWLVISLMGSGVNYYFGETCYSESNRFFPSPTGEKIIFYSTEICSKKGIITLNESNVGIYRADAPGSQTIFYKTDSDYVNDSGVKYSQISYGVKWESENFVKIEYPTGINIFDGVWSNQPFPKSGIRQEKIGETKVEFYPGAL